MTEDYVTELIRSITIPLAMIHEFDKKAEEIILAYLRVSTEKQNEERQKTQIFQLTGELDESCIFTDKETGRNFDREHYKRLKETVRPGNTVYITEVNRFGRTFTEMLLEFLWFLQNGIKLRILQIYHSLSDPAPGQENDYYRNYIMFFVVFAMQAEGWLERHDEAVKTAVENRKKSGKYNGPNHKGRGRVYMDKLTFAELCDKLDIGDTTQNDMATIFGVTPPVISNRIKEKRQFDSWLKQHKPLLEQTGQTILYDPSKTPANQIKRACKLLGIEERSA